MHTVEMNSVVWCTPPRLTGGVMHMSEIDLAVSCTPRSLSPRSDAYRGLCLPGVMQTAEFVSSEWCIPQRFRDLCVLGSWKIWNNWLWGMMYIVHYTAESDLAKCDTHRGFSGDARVQLNTTVLSTVREYLRGVRLDSSTCATDYCTLLENIWGVWSWIPPRVLLTTVHC